jgi:hypothetical protein
MIITLPPLLPFHWPPCRSCRHWARRSAACPAACRPPSRRRCPAAHTASCGVTAPRTTSSEQAHVARSVAGCRTGRCGASCELHLYHWHRLPKASQRLLHLVCTAATPSTAGRLQGGWLSSEPRVIKSLPLQCSCLLSAGARCAARSTNRARRWRRCRAATSTTPTALRSGCSTRRWDQHGSTVCVDTNRAAMILRLTAFTVCCTCV